MNSHGGRREGAGRKPGSPLGMQTKTVRVTIDISTEQCKAIPDLIALLDYWESRADDSPRYYYLKTLIDEARGLGF